MHIYLIFNYLAFIKDDWGFISESHIKKIQHPIRFLLSAALFWPLDKHIPWPA